MITDINHITFATIDLEASLDFYCGLLQFKLVAKWRSGAYLVANKLWICLSYNQTTPNPPSPAYTHIAFSISKANFLKLEEKANASATPIWKKNTSEGLSLYLLDPDHHKLEIHCGDLQTRLAHMLKNPYEDMEIYSDLNDN